MTETQTAAVRGTWLTTTIVLINVGVYVVMCLRGVSPTQPSVAALVAFGGNVRVLTIDYGQYWRLFTCMWVHAGILHIGMNMWCLWVIGRFLERTFGAGFLALAYLFSGLIGSLASIALHDNIVSVGASGAIFGLYGFLLGFLLRHRRAVNPQAVSNLGKSALAFVGYNLLFGFAVKGIDISAHIGGLVGGFGVGLLKPFRRSE